MTLAEMVVLLGDRWQTVQGLASPPACDPRVRLSVVCVCVCVCVRVCVCVNVFTFREGFAALLGNVTNLDVVCVCVCVCVKSSLLATPDRMVPWCIACPL